MGDTDNINKDDDDRAVTEHSAIKTAGDDPKQYSSVKFVAAKKKSLLRDALIDDFAGDCKNNNDAQADKRNTEEERGMASEEHFRRNKQRFDTLLKEELEIRGHVGSMPGAQGKGGFCNVVGSSIINMAAAFLVFVFYLISLETLLSIGLSIGLTIYCYHLVERNPSVDGSVMDWVLLSFAVITPLSAAIRMSFSRRDQALVQIANFKATMIHLYSSHACWDWPQKGQKPTGRDASEVEWLKHCDEVLLTMCQICSELTRLLTLPTANRGRHRVIPYGRTQRAEIATVARKLRRSILSDMSFLTDKCEVLKREGLPPNEATRVRQWERFLTTQIEQLLVIKKYRTPQALRSFARIFSVFLPPFYAPFYAQMALDLQSLGMGIAFSILTSIALTSLFESVFQLEDPFVGSRLDCIDVENELRDEFLVQLIDLRDYYFPEAPAFEVDVQIPAPETSPEIRLFRA